MAAEHPAFRLGSILATSFTGTLTERCGEPVERLPTPQRLADWLHVWGLDVRTCTPDHLRRARTLRESIHAAATAAATGEPLPRGAVSTINESADQGGAAPHLSTSGGHEWRLRDGAEVTDALGVIAADAIDLLSGSREGRWALCASPTCRAAFFDTSRSGSRRWCDMNTCGNREKKARRRSRADQRAG